MLQLQKSEPKSLVITTASGLTSSEIKSICVLSIIVFLMKSNAARKKPGCFSSGNSVGYAVSLKVIEIA
jgi:hypothetical protein